MRPSDAPARRRRAGGGPALPRRLRRIRSLPVVQSPRGGAHGDPGAVQGGLLIAAETNSPDPPSQDPVYLELIRFQVCRLQQTYRDLTEDSRYALLAKFFFEDVYSTRDKERRDASAQALHAKVRQVLGEEPVRNLERVIELNELTDRLDFALVRKLHALGVSSVIREPRYEEAYFLCDNYEDRMRQIELILHSIRYFHGLAQYRSIGMGLKILRPYALLRKATALLDFLQNGYRAFRSIKNIDPFYECVKVREIERLNRIYSLGRKVPSDRELRRRARELGIRDSDHMEIRRLMRAMAQWM